MAVVVVELVVVEVTSMTVPSALDKVGVRRLAFYIQKHIAQLIRENMFLNDDSSLKDKITYFLIEILLSNGLEDGHVIVEGDHILVSIRPRLTLPEVIIEFTVSRE